ncbi:putative niacin/nicotinamide transporter NaiP [Streptomyces sp. YIM 130001]|uniref:MFS transporter n=1 Tax=Streptomyces sp. YIM 130001 TaxID=2259644 RepID=UPI000E64E410|nr:MFS transporter [Streptomyces sp. YIM 130001]RII14004.1 putative niacin/nicotinamide transporter NaiP [Streptomyces sp. YIM 130001]
MSTSSSPSDKAASKKAPDTSPSDAEAGRMAWFSELSPRGRRAFFGAYGGYGLDAYDFYVLPLSMAAIGAYFALDNGQTGLLATTTLVVSAVGGALAGVFADRVGRVKALMWTVGVYAVFTVACGLAPNFETLLVFRALQGLGFGGEWAVGAVLVAEYASSRHRGRTLGWIQSAWAIGWGLAVLAYTVVFHLVGDDLAWRVLFFTGALPALLLIYIRRSVTDAPVAKERLQGADGRHGGPIASFAAIFRGRLLRTTLLAALMSTGVQGGYYTLATWMPNYLATERGLAVTGVGGFLVVQIAGAFSGYITGAHLADRLGRRATIQLFAVLSAVCVLAYSQVPAGWDGVSLLLGFPLGFCMSAIFSSFGSFLAELYPTEVRGTGQGFTYNMGRGIGAVFPTIVGFLSDSWGVGGALTFAAAGYALAFVALFGLPETSGTELR